MRRIKLYILVIISAIAVSNTLNAQILHPVRWSYAAKKIDKKEAILFVKATIEEGWHIYSVNQKEGGPQKTGFTFIPSNTYRITNEIQEPTPITKYEKVFAMDVHYFERMVVFQQKVILNSKNVVVKGKISFMVCNDEKCLPPDEVQFNIPIK